MVDSDNSPARVYSVSRARTRCGRTKLYWCYSIKSLRIVLSYGFREHPALTRHEKLGNTKPLREIVRECRTLWQKCREFPFQYFVAYLWLNKVDEHSGTENSTPYIRHEVERNKSGSLRAKEVLSGRVLKTAVSSDCVCKVGLHQIPELARLNSDSVNSLRVVTRFRGAVVEIVSALLRIGRVGSFVDNTTSEGMVCGADRRRAEYYRGQLDFGPQSP